jgi:hypothetical protein
VSDPPAALHCPPHVVALKNACVGASVVLEQFCPSSTATVPICVEGQADVPLRNSMFPRHVGFPVQVHAEQARVSLTPVLTICCSV